MNTALFEEAIAMPPVERVALAEAILASIDEEKDSVKDVWINEVKNRMKAVEEGRAELYEMEELFGS
ncbi:MAG: antitoxin [Spartobacteria bacterium]|nr:antitoxin [Spartobacteria bacterium]